MISNIEIIKGLMREFYQTRMVVSIDNDDFESFFLTKGKLVAFDCEEFDLWNKPYKLVCKMTQDKLSSQYSLHLSAQDIFFHRKTQWQKERKTATTLLFS
jgi:hypothetical protein